MHFLYSWPDYASVETFPHLIVYPLSFPALMNEHLAFLSSQMYDNVKLKSSCVLEKVKQEWKTAEFLLTTVVLRMNIY